MNQFLTILQLIVFIFILVYLRNTGNFYNQLLISYYASVRNHVKDRSLSIKTRLFVYW